MITIIQRYHVKIVKISCNFENKGLVGKIYISKGLLELFGKNRSDLAPVKSAPMPFKKDGIPRTAKM